MCKYCCRYMDSGFPIWQRNFWVKFSKLNMAIKLKEIYICIRFISCVKSTVDQAVVFVWKQSKGEKNAGIYFMIITLKFIRCTHFYPLWIFQHSF